MKTENKRTPGYGGLIKGPLSKYVVLASQFEAWLCAIVCIVYAWFDKDISSLITIVTVSWAGYELVKGAYIWMAKAEHIEDLKTERIKISKELGVSDDDEFLDAMSESLKSDI